MKDKDGIQILTKCVHGVPEMNEENLQHYGAISYPIYQTATFAHPGIGESTGYDYSRLQNPTREKLEQVVASLEGGMDALAFCTGMAAIATLMELFVPGDHLLVDTDLYGGSVRLFQNICIKNGIEITYCDMSCQSISAFIRPSTKAIYLETPTNPMMHVIDLFEMSRIAKENGLLLLVDNTFLSPYFQNPLLIGADVVIHSGTKYLGGHNDTLAGLLVTSRADISDRLRFLIKTTGAGLSPFDSWLILRGIKTLGIRMEQSQRSAMELAVWLQEKEGVEKVIYPGLPSHPGYEVMKRQSRGFGSMITIVFQTEQIARNILHEVTLIQFAESLGGVETLITYPIMQTHADVPEDMLCLSGINDRTLRLSVGIEDVTDLINDLHKAITIAMEA